MRTDQAEFVKFILILLNRPDRTLKGERPGGVFRPRLDFGIEFLDFNQRHRTGPAVGRIV